ncbi:NAD(P)/FAD-dependent oxidoreductase [Candidatus Solincola sp.]|nr:FAD-dependent oxidoreductase [Actinomycetota bacterium]MDI7251940.1 FAD-dependent oxidoreductase [Actinomycetota bacterium]
MAKVRKPDLVVIGAGPAGLGAALAAREAGLRDVMLIERDVELGGILPQCIHDGFGSIVFGETLTGPQYAQRFIDRVEKADMDIKLNTMVLDLRPDRSLTAVNSRDGILEIKPRAVVLAMGCRERTRHQVLIPGYRPAGVICAGAAQRDINIEGLMPGRRVVILGSGDIGLIMARRFTLEGAEVEGVYEIMDHPGGLTRNLVQCLHDYDIPLHLSHTVTFIHGRKRVEAVTVSRVDGNLKPMPGTERLVPCDTLVLSVGLIPENELSRRAGVVLDPATGGPVVDERMETSVEGIFACGNVMNVFDLVDYVTHTAEVAGRAAAEYVLRGVARKPEALRVRPGRNVRFVVPQLLRGYGGEVSFYFRVSRPERAVRARLVTGGIPLAAKRARMVRPPEMVRLRADPERLVEALSRGDLTVEVVPEDEGPERQG